jgi:hypothetical protein
MKKTVLFAVAVCNQYTYANCAATYATIGFRCCVH